MKDVYFNNILNVLKLLTKCPEETNDFIRVIKYIASLSRGLPQTCTVILLSWKLALTRQ